MSTSTVKEENENESEGGTTIPSIHGPDSLKNYAYQGPQTSSSSNCKFPDVISEDMKWIKSEDPREWSTSSSRVATQLAKDHGKVQVFHLQDLEFQEHLGEGAFGTVDKYQMFPNNDRTKEPISVAVKRLRSQISIFDGMKMVQKRIRWGPKEIDEFTREVRLQAALKHENIVNVYGMGSYHCIDSSDDLPFVVQELMGSTLKDALHTSYTMSTGLTWCRQIAEGLKFLHSCNPIIIHRDLKPENVLLSEDRKTAKVADFGLFMPTLRHSNALLSNPNATVRHLPGNLDFLDVEQLQVQHEACMPTGQTGTMRYMAPENYRGELYSHKVDVYSFAMLMYAVLNKSEAYADIEQRFTPEQLAMSAAQINGIRPTIKKKWPEELKRLLEDCWDYHPDKRPSFRTILERIDALMSMGELDAWMEEDTGSAPCGGCVIS